MARFGPWTCETPIANVRDVCRTGPYRWFKAIGPRGSFVDRGLHVRHDNRGRCLRPVARAGARPRAARIPSSSWDHAHRRGAGTVRRVVAATRGSRVSGRAPRSGPGCGRDGLHRATAGRRARCRRAIDVRCLARTPDKLDAESWRAHVEVVTGDVLDRGVARRRLPRTSMRPTTWCTRSVRSRTGRRVTGRLQRTSATRPPTPVSNRSSISAGWGTTPAARCRRILRAGTRSVACWLPDLCH